MCVPKVFSSRNHLCTVGESGLQDCSDNCKLGVLWEHVAQKHPVPTTGFKAANGKAKFLFPDFELGSIYFQHQARGLNASINRAISEGCMNNWEHGDMDIEIIFESELSNSSQYYIQFNMEQLTNKDRFHSRYNSKMKNAVQLWDWSFFHCRDDKLHLGRHCLSIPFWHTDPEDWIQYPDKPPTTDAIFFGSIGCPGRTALCQVLTKNMVPGTNHKIHCIDNAHGEDLKPHILSTKIVFVEHCYAGAVLPVHRINQVLSRGVPVISTVSSDHVLDTMYSHMGVVLSDHGIAPQNFNPNQPNVQRPTLAKDLLDLLDDEKSLAEARTRARRYNVMKQRCNAGLCKALHQLNTDMRDKKGN